MNTLQKHNHAILRRHIFSPRIITSVNILPNGIISLPEVEWKDYWGVSCLQPLLDNLFVSWQAWIVSRFNRTKLNNYIYDYFRLLETGLDAYQSENIDICLLNKIVAFETFLVSAANSGACAASLFSTRNPSYLLHKIPNPIACDNPKYLPVICQREQSQQTARLYFHYRRIPVKHSRETQLFVYPAVASTAHECSGFDIIDLLFRVLTRQNDPWIKFRCASLAKSIFNDLVLSLNKAKVNLLDLGCGSAKISMRLCALAHVHSKSEFDVLLVDTIPSRFSIARSFYNNYQAFEAIRYKRSNLFNWVANMQNDTRRYDITLMLRFLDTLCQYQAQSLSHEQISRAMKQSDTTVSQIPTSQQILESPDKIIHSLHKIHTQDGSAYFQPCLRDYFKAVFLCCNINNYIQNNNEIVLPVRVFDENRLIMQDGVSILERIMAKSRHLIIEDSEVSLELLMNHAQKRQLNHLTFTNTQIRRGFSGSHCTLVSHSRRHCQ